MKPNFQWFQWFEATAEDPDNACRGREKATRQGCIKLLDFSLSSIGWRRGLEFGFY